MYFASSIFPEKLNARLLFSVNFLPSIIGNSDDLTVDIPIIQRSRQDQTMSFRFKMHREQVMKLFIRATIITATKKLHNLFTVHLEEKKNLYLSLPISSHNWTRRSVEHGTHALTALG